jgi:lipoprotein-releasing system permease protein
VPLNRDSLALFIGLRYSFTRQKNRFIGVVSLVSLVGMALGVASLITVLSVMNGFAGELRGRILSLVPHVQLSSQEGPIEQWTGLGQKLAADEEVIAVAPYVESKALLSAAGQVRGAVLTAIDPAAESAVSKVASHLRQGRLENLNEQSYGVVLGSLLARALGVRMGDSLEVTIPQLTVTPLGTFPRSKRFTVVGIFEVGAKLDSSQAYISLRSGQKLFAMGTGVEGLRLRLEDLYRGPAVAARLSAELGDSRFQVRDWSQTQGSLFAAVKMEKNMIAVLLLSVVAVAAFNIISTLTMAVTDKRGDIAVLRTMGARAGSIMAIFVAHGLILASCGVAVGVLLGVSLALNISEVTLFVEQLFGVKLFNPQVYFISDLPAELQWPDVFKIAGLSLLLGLLATLFPAWRATRVAPAEVLRYE